MKLKCIKLPCVKLSGIHSLKLFVIVLICGVVFLKNCKYIEFCFVFIYRMWVFLREFYGLKESI